MNSTTQCTRCSGPTRPGVLQTVGNYGNTPFEWAPDGEPPFRVAGAPSARKRVVALRCERCGHLSFFAP